ncbi:MAG: GNAT family N-acetyltransferase [Planctomycetes bacterium]|nr:GNAT family N-acetyltransferase [Planctomycetota bacterium]
MLTIRKVKAIKEFHSCEAIQKAVWQFEDREIIPVNELITIQHNGGLVLGAFDKDKMIGFCFGFPGIRDGKLVHSSRMLAVLPEYRNTGIGLRMKLAQKKFAFSQGIDLITWTFDPLQSLNAHFNIAKLGCIVRQYFVNIYGTSSSVLNSGMETDRFLAEWHINRVWSLDSKSLRKVLKNIRQVNKTAISKSGFLISEKPDLRLNDKRLLVQIPGNINEIKAKDLALAKDWRLKTRVIFMAYFKKGYAVRGFISLPFREGAAYCYILNKTGG